MSYKNIKMLQQDAFSLLFVDDFQGKPLFKNQVELATELLSHPASDYYIDKGNKEEYLKALSRLKALVSQLFSPHSKRTISPEFKRSLEIILKEKSESRQFDVAEILQQIVSDLKERNIARRTPVQVTKRESEKYPELAYEIQHAAVITIYTAREIDIELQLPDKRMPVNAFLVEDLIFSLQNEREIKKYHFNFPLEQLCILFWRGLRNEIAHFISHHSHTLFFIIPFLRTNEWPTDYGTEDFPNFSEGVESTVASELLLRLSKINIINVYHLQAPIYIASILSIDVNQNNNSTYLCFKTDEDEEQLYKLSRQDMFFSRLFVWDHLKMKKQGSLMKYQASF
jgi:hypothetical protein